VLTGRALNKTRFDKGDYLIAVQFYERVGRVVDKDGAPLSAGTWAQATSTARNYAASFPALAVTVALSVTYNEGAVTVVAAADGSGTEGR